MSEEEEEEDYVIEMELRSQPQQTLDFEFQILKSLTNPNNNNKSEKELELDTPADDLFYKGKLLPLLLPSRRQMLNNLTLVDFTEMPFPQDHNYHSMPSTHTLNTPSHSRTISPSQSCRVSCDLNPDDHHHRDFFFQWSTQFNDNNNNKNINIINNNNQSSRKRPMMPPWPKKLKLGKKLLRSSGAYLKSLFSNKKSDNCNSGRKNGEIATECRKKNPTTIAAIIESAECVEEQRRSFSSAIKRHYPAAVKCLSSSSSSSSSNSFHELRRSSSATEIEGSILAAIAHCKNSAHHNKISGFCSI